MSWQIPREPIDDLVVAHELALHLARERVANIHSEPKGDAVADYQDLALGRGARERGTKPVRIRSDAIRATAVSLEIGLYRCRVLLLGVEIEGRGIELYFPAGAR